MRFPCAVALLLVLHSALRVAAQNPACLLNCINGNCYTNGNSFACVCSAGYGGSLCEEGACATRAAHSCVAGSGCCRVLEIRGELRVACHIFFASQPSSGRVRHRLRRQLRAAVLRQRRAVPSQR